MRTIVRTIESTAMHVATLFSCRRLLAIAGSACDVQTLGAPPPLVGGSELMHGFREAVACLPRQVVEPLLLEPSPCIDGLYLGQRPSSLRWLWMLRLVQSVEELELAVPALLIARRQSASSVVACSVTGGLLSAAGVGCCVGFRSVPVVSAIGVGLAVSLPCFA